MKLEAGSEWRFELEPEEDIAIRVSRFEHLQEMSWKTFLRIRTDMTCE